MSKPHVIVIGAGFTGVAMAHDLALRGFEVTVVERGQIVNGTSGRTASCIGLRRGCPGSNLALPAVTTPCSARECRRSKS